MSVRAKTEGLAGAGVAVAFALGHIVVLGPPTWREWEHQPFWVSLGVAVSSGVLAWTGSRALGALLATAALLVGIVGPGVRVEWSEETTRWIALALIGGGTYGLLDLTSRLAPRLGRIDGPSLLGLLAAGLGVLAYASSYAKAAFLAGVLGGVLLPACLVVAWPLGKRLPTSLVLAGTSIAVALLLGIWFHTLADRRAPLLSFIALGVSPLAAWVGELRLLADRPRGRAAARILAVAAIVAASALAALFGDGQTAEPPEYDYEW